MKSSNIKKMPKLMTIFKRNLEFLSSQEQLYEINSLIHSLNNTNFNFTFYAVNKKYSILSELNKCKKDILNSHYQCKKIKYIIGNSLSYFSNWDNTEKLIPYFTLLSNYNKMTIQDICTNDYIPTLSQTSSVIDYELDKIDGDKELTLEEHLNEISLPISNLINKKK